MPFRGQVRASRPRTSGPGDRPRIDSRRYGNENWEFDADGLMKSRIASINDLPIPESERKYRWPLGPRPAEHAGLSDLGL